MKTTSYIALLSLSICSLMLSAQPIPPYEGRPSNIPYKDQYVVDQHSNVYTLSKVNKQGSCAVQKYDRAGKEQWNYVFRGPTQASPLRLQVGPQGGAYVYGKLPDSSIVNISTTEQRTASYAPNGNAQRLFVCHFNAHGHIEWIRTWEHARFMSILDLQIDQQSNVYVLGSHRGAASLAPQQPNVLTAPPDSTAPVQGFVLQFDSIGQYRWGRSFAGDNEVHPQFLRLDATQRFAYLVTRWRTPFVPKSPPRSSDSFYEQYLGGHVLNDSTCLYKLHTSTGRPEWRRNFSGTNNLLVADLDLAEDGHLYCVGQLLQPEDTSDNRYSASTSMRRQGVVVQLNDAGQEQWTHYYQSADVVSPEAVHVDAQGEVCILGMYQKTLTIPFPSRANHALLPSNDDTYEQCCHGYFIHTLDPTGKATGALNICNLGEPTAEYILKVADQWHQYPNLHEIHPLLNPSDSTTWVVLYESDNTYHSSYQLPPHRSIVNFVPMGVDSFDEQTFEESPHGLHSDQNYQVEVIQDRRSQRLPYYWRFRREE